MQSLQKNVLTNYVEIVLKIKEKPEYFIYLFRSIFLTLKTFSLFTSKFNWVIEAEAYTKQQKKREPKFSLLKIYNHFKLNTNMFQWIAVVELKRHKNVVKTNQERISWKYIFSKSLSFAFVKFVYLCKKALWFLLQSLK